MNDPVTLRRERLSAVMNYIEEHPREHRSDTWGERDDCGTVACFAGWACILFAADQVEFRESYSPERQVLRPKDRRIGMGELARQVLGLTHEQATQLFLNARRVRGCRLIVDHLIANPSANGDELSALLWPRSNWAR